MTRWGEPVMHRPCARVESFDERLAQLVADMFVTMYAADGVGLAANQVGESLSVFVFDVRPRSDHDAAADDGAPIDDDRPPVGDGSAPTTASTGLVGVVANPVLTIPDEPRQEWIKESEGCLSLPGAFVPCKRALLAHVRGVDHRGQPVSYGGSDLLARCLQHETDHLSGTVFGDLLPSRLRKKLHAQADRLAEQYPADWPVSPRQRPADEPADETAPPAE